MKTEIISIGNELLIGDTINTNASWMGSFMTELGFEVSRVHTIPDDPLLIRSLVGECMSRAEVTLCTGGLGPTHDDVTKKAVAEFFGVSMKVDEGVLKFVRSRFEKWNIPFSKSNYDQAEVPENAEVLFNNKGSAPGMWFEKGGHYLAVMPGVPYEMKFLMEQRVLPKLREHVKNLGVRYSRYIKTVGIGESTLSDEVLGDLSSFLREGVSMAFLPMPGGVVLRLNGIGVTEKQARAMLEPLAEHIYSTAAPHIIGEGKEFSLSEAVGNLLREKELSIATAESCTGGLIADELTNIPGSSDYMMGGIVAYSNEVKVQELNVEEEDLQNVGAVSKEVALQMAKGVAKRFNTSIGVSTTGIAGPGGGTKEKPVGTVWVGYWSKDTHFAIMRQFSKDRLLNKERSARLALDMVRRTLRGIEEMPYNTKKHFP